MHMWTPGEAPSVMKMTARLLSSGASSAKWSMAEVRPATAGVPPENVKSSAGGITARMSADVWCPKATSGWASTRHEKLLVGSSR